MDGVLNKYDRDIESLKQAWPIVLGLCIVFIPTIYTLNTGPWEKSEYAHGPIVLLVVLWLFIRSRYQWITLTSQPANLAGGVLLAFGCLLYALGRSQTILLFEVGSSIFIITGALLVTKGWHAIRQLWFPIAFLIFLIPLPGFIIDGLTGPLKMQVSYIVNDILYAFGYPIARTGVVLSIGPYQLLIADACSGLNSMYALTALGLLFVYLRKGISKVHAAVLLLAILPIAFITNIARVIALSLLTYYFGDSAGQGFSHDFAAVAEFLIALMMLFTLDNILSRILSEPVRS